MELDPHQLIEGVAHRLLRASAPRRRSCTCGARWPSPRSGSRQALNDAYAKGYVGKNILGTDFSVDITLHVGRRRLHRRRGDRAHREPRGRAGHAPAEAAVLPGRQGPVHAADDREQRRDAVERPVDREQRRRRVTRARAPTSTGMRMFAVSGHVNRPGVFEVAQRRHHVPRAVRGARVLRRHPRRPRAQGVHPRRRVGAVVLRRAPRPAARQADGRQGRLDARARAPSSSWTRPPTWCKAVLARRAVLRPGDLRQVHAVPRGHHVARADPATASSTATAAPTTSTC